MNERDYQDLLARTKVARAHTDAILKAFTPGTYPAGDQFDIQNARARAGALAALDRNSSLDPEWPWGVINDLAGPLLPGLLVVIGGYAGNGKTAFLLNIARALLGRDVAWAFFGLELADETLTQLFAALDCGLPRHDVIENTLTEAERRALVGSIEALAVKSPLMHFVPDPEATADAVAQRTYELHRARGVRVVILDHLHHLNYDTAASLRTGVSQAVRTLKSVAKELGVTFLVSAQLRRASDDKAQAYRTPGLSELMESGTIEQVADIVLFTHRQVQPGKFDLLRAFQRGDPAIRVSDFALPSRMGVTLAKHRFGRPVGITVSLHLHTPSDRLTEV